MLVVNELDRLDEDEPAIKEEPPDAGEVSVPEKSQKKILYKVVPKPQTDSPGQLPTVRDKKIVRVIRPRLLLKRHVTSLSEPVLLGKNIQNAPTTSKDQANGCTSYQTGNDCTPVIKEEPLFDDDNSLVTNAISVFTQAEPVETPTPPILPYSNVPELSNGDLCFVGRNSTSVQTNRSYKVKAPPVQVQIMFPEDSNLSNQAKDIIVNVYEYLRVQGFRNAVKETVNATRVHIKIVESILTEVGYLGPDANPNCSHGPLPKDATSKFCPCLLLVAKRRFEPSKIKKQKNQHTWSGVITDVLEERIHAIWLELWGKLNRQPFVYEIMEEGVKDMPELNFGKHLWEKKLWELRKKWGEVDDNTAIPIEKAKRRKKNVV